MNRLKNITYDITLALNVLLVFLLLFASYLQVPAWLQVAGRLHPLVLHFPIVLLLLAVALQLPTLKEKTGNDAMVEGLLLAGCLLASFTALSGLLLSQEEGYNPDDLEVHKWLGAATSLISFIWYTWRANRHKTRWTFMVAGPAVVVLLIMAGHTGAGLTHGSDFLLEHLRDQKQAQPVAFDDAQVFADMVKPILDKKCTGCHNNKKAKGDLVMETEALLLKGGKNGKLWDNTAAGPGLMMQRIHLPMQDKKHMPPKGKPQLTDEEQIILGQWIKLGAPFNMAVASLPDSNELRLQAVSTFASASQEVFAFKEADAGAIRKLNTANRVVYSLAQGSPALIAQFYGPSLYNANQLDELKAVKDQLVSLNLNRMPVKDEDLKKISSFQNLRSINLAFTDITGAGLRQLSGLKNLKRLTISGNNITASNLQVLNAVPQLERLFAWNTGIKPNERIAIEKQLKQCHIVWGYNGDTLVLQLNAPIIQNEKQFIEGSTRVQVKHYLPGVDLRYTLNGKEPDSIQSPQYHGDLKIDSAAQFKVKAFKPGWISSDVVDMMFYKNKFSVDSITLKFPPAEAYSGKGGATLHDLDVGDKNFRSGKWLGFKDHRLEAVLYFDKAITASKLTLSCLVDITSYIMPPQNIEVWGGTDVKNLKLISRLLPPQPDKEVLIYLKAYELHLKPTEVTLIKLVATPVRKLPAWHSGKGDKGWVFVDEILVN